MKHTALSTLLNALSALALFSGLGLIGWGAPLYASLSAEGAYFLQQAMPDGVEVITSGDMPNAYAAADAAIQLAFGILLITLGFFLHGLARARDERAVHITVKKPKRKASLFWMEMRV